VTTGVHRERAMLAARGAARVTAKGADDRLLTPIVNDAASLLPVCHRRDDSISRPGTALCLELRHLSGTGGCVWCVTLKDPERLPSKRQDVGLAAPS